MAGLQELSTKNREKFHGTVLRSLASLIRREAGMEKSGRYKTGQELWLCYAIHSWPTCSLCTTGQSSFSFPQKAGRVRALSFSTSQESQDQSLLPRVTGRDHSPQHPWWCWALMGPWGCSQRTECKIKEHPPLTLVIEKEIFNLNCCVLKSGVLRNSMLCASQVCYSIKVNWDW